MFNREVHIADGFENQGMCKILGEFLIFRETLQVSLKVTIKVLTVIAEELIRISQYRTGKRF